MLCHRTNRSKKVQMQARAVAVWGAVPGAAISRIREPLGWLKNREATQSTVLSRFHSVCKVHKYMK